jgi:hypothetical protein
VLSVFYDRSCQIVTVVPHVPWNLADLIPFSQSNSGVRTSQNGMGPTSSNDGTEQPVVHVTDGNHSIPLARCS